MKSVSKIVKNVVADAIGLIIIGFLLVLWAKHSLVAIFQLIGIGLIVIGVLKWVLYFFDKEEKDRKIIDLVVGTIMIGAGFFLFVKADPLSNLFPIVSSILLGYGAVRMIIQAVEARMDSMPKFLCPLIFGIISLMCAVIILVHPVFLLDIMVQASGCAMIIEGIFLLILLLI